MAFTNNIFRVKFSFKSPHQHGRIFNHNHELALNMKSRNVNPNGGLNTALALHNGLRLRLITRHLSGEEQLVESKTKIYILKCKRQHLYNMLEKRSSKHYRESKITLSHKQTKKDTFLSSSHGCHESACLHWDSLHTSKFYKVTTFLVKNQENLCLTIQSADREHVLCSNTVFTW